MMIYTKLNNARLKFHQLKLQKSGLNKFAGYSYFELADFLIPAMDVFSNHGLCAYISFGKDLATMKIVDVESGEFIDITSPMSTAALKGCHEVQNLGAVQSYLRRYLWVAALEIVEHNALDSSKPLSDEPKFSVNDSIRVLKSAPNLDALTSYFKVEVAKYPPSSPDYKALKAEATAQRKYLEEMAVSA